MLKIILLTILSRCCAGIVWPKVIWKFKRLDLSLRGVKRRSNPEQSLFRLRSGLLRFARKDGSRIMCILALSLFAKISLVTASTAAIPLLKAHNNLKDPASLQRGAQLYVNYCQGCHSLQYTRYSQLRDYLGINLKDESDQFGTPESINLSNNLIKDNLNFVSDKVTDPILSSMPKKDAEKWFGVAPPDLTLVTRVRGTDWVYTYLKSFYKDDSRPWGVNNKVFPNVGMPHVLLSLESELTPKQYDQAVTDIVNFLEYVGEPVKLKRQYMGVFVLLFLSILTIFLYLLKREYWKDIH